MTSIFLFFFISKLLILYNIYLQNFKNYRYYNNIITVSKNLSRKIYMISIFLHIDNQDIDSQNHQFA